MAGDDGLSEYERQRNLNIAANMEVLKSLGLGGGGGHVVPTKQKIKKLKDVSARKPKATGDFAAFCKEKKVRTPTPPAPPCAFPEH